MPQRNPKKMKLQYSVDMGHLWTIDSIRYTNFPPANDSLIRRNLDKAVIHPGDPFDVSTLEQERKRITDLFRNNGYYYYQNNYASYLADTNKHAMDRADMRLQMADSGQSACLTTVVYREGNGQSAPTAHGFTHTSESFPRPYGQL